MSTRKIHDRVCEICGVSFKGGKFSHVCDECRAKSRKGRAKNLRRDKADSALGFEKMMESYQAPFSTNRSLDLRFVPEL